MGEGLDYQDCPIPKGPDVCDLDRDLAAGAPGSRTYDDEDHHLIVAIEESLRLYYPGLKRRELIVDERLRLVRTESRPLKLGSEFEVRVRLAPQALPITAVQGRVAPAHDLHVLLRHRLLRQPGGFEGCLPSDEAPESEDLAASHQEVDGEWLVEVNVAGVPS